MEIDNDLLWLTGRLRRQGDSICVDKRNSFKNIQILRVF
ncbi:hypothetical protein GM3708_1500 [Geminocystis sp. NIES-3708]|nr:hypothetical protein GM3708_1500 [Geminocystis sp. NIES-3708]